MGVTPPRIYLDSCIIIYLVEEHPVYSSRLESRLQQVPGATICFSALNEMECLVKPLRDQNQPLLAKFQRWFERAEFLPYDRGLFHAAARMRAMYPALKTPDAIHLSTAFQHGCSELWTNDGRLGLYASSLAVQVI